MKKYLFIVFLLCLTNNLFADTKKEIENFVKKDYSEDDIKKMYLKIDNLTVQKKYSEAFKICNKIESHFKARYKHEKDILSVVLLGRSYIIKARVCCSINDLTQAVSLTRKAVELYEKFPYLKQSKQYPKLKALLNEREIMLKNTYYSKSIEKVHELYALDKYEDAEKITGDLLKKAQKDKNVNNKLLSLINFLLGRNLVAQHKKISLVPLEKSLYYFSKIKKGKEQFFDDYLTYDIYSFLSFAYKLNNQPKNSLKYAKLAYSIVCQQKKLNSDALIGTAIVLAHAYKACDDKTNAVKYAKKTLKLMKKDPTLKSRLHLIKGSIKEWSE